MTFARILAMILAIVGIVQFLNNNPIDGLIFFMLSYRFSTAADLMKLEDRIKVLETQAGIKSEQ